MHITDRAKDVIKSGGEWISSIDIENIAVGHPAVAEAAVIGMPHPKWDERPLLVIVQQARARSRPGKTSSDYLEARSPNGGCRTMWCSWTIFPHTATGKIQKTTLRDQFAGYTLPTAG